MEIHKGPIEETKEEIAMNLATSLSYFSKKVGEYQEVQKQQEALADKARTTLLLTEKAIKLVRENERKAAERIEEILATILKSARNTSQIVTGEKK